MFDQTGDPDYYYHVAMSRHVLDQGIPDTVPQVKGIGWDILFSDKEFLFHQLTAAFYSLFGEMGLKILPVVVSSGTALILAWQAIKRLGWKWAALPFVLILADPYFVRRVLMVRPQVLAVFFFSLLLYGLLGRRKWIVFVATVGYTLSYHALQIPVSVLIAGTMTYVSSDEGRKKSLWALAAGLVAGIFLNPYFPGNLTILPQIVDIIFAQKSQGGLPYGSELYAWQSDLLIGFSLLTFFVTGFVIYCLGYLRQSHNADPEIRDQKMLLILAALYFVISCLTPRGREYLTPTLFFLAIAAIGQREHFTVHIKKWKMPFALALIAVGAVQALRAKDHFAALAGGPLPQSEIMKAVLSLPTDAKGHVLNCNWSQSPQIMYARPLLTFLDIMDPSYLARENPALHEARNDFVRLRFPDAHFAAKNIFRADYVICDSGPTNEMMDRDPRFERIHPMKPVKMSKDTTAVFKVSQSAPSSAFINDFEYRVGGDEKRPWTAFRPTMRVSSDEKVPAPVLDFFDFRTQLKAQDLRDARDEKTLNCIFVRPAPNEMKKHAGTELLGLGGGPNFRVWWNGKPLFESRGEERYAAIIQTFVPLPRPLAATDELKILVCPATWNVVKDSYFGAALSFWRPQEIDEICRARKSADSPSERGKLEWPYKGNSVKTCLADIAARR